MKKTFLNIIFLLSLVIVSNAQEKKVVGYYSNNEWNNLDNCEVDDLTHLNIAFANPNSSGDIQIYNRTTIKNQIKKIKEKNVKVLLAVAGGGLTTEQRQIWAHLVKPENVDNFIDKVITTLQTDGYDGIDLDLEHEDFLSMLGSNYAPFVNKLHQKLKENDFLLTTALFATYSYSVLTSDVLALFDYINVMAYDATGNWNINRPGQHSPISLAKNGIDFWVNKGIPRDKIILGLPFYGYDFDEEPLHSWRDFLYSDMVNLNPDYAYLDQVGEKYYNGINTIKVKTILSENQCGGVMIWHISCDIKGKYSLLKAIKEAKEEYKVDIARDKQVTSTELERNDCPTEYATDGNPTTRWSGKPLNPAYLTIDLGTIKEFSNLTIDWESSYAKSYEIQISNDNTNWTTIKTFTDQELLVVSEHAPQYITDLDAKGRYLRLKMTKGTEVNGKIWCYSLWDIRVSKKGLTPVKNIKTRKLHIYPNPATDKISIEGLDENILVKLYSISGRLLLKTKNKTLDVNCLKSGVYLIVAETKNERFLNQFIKN